MFTIALAAAVIACTGAVGPKGDQGDPGPQGMQGPAGAMGPAGPPGTFSGVFDGGTTFNGNVQVNGDVTVNGNVTTVSGGGLIMPGAVMTFAGLNCPSGWLKANGQPQPRSLYPELFAVIGTTYGAPSSTTFNLPELRGVFIRGLQEFAMQNANGPSGSYTHGPATFPKAGMNGNLFGGAWQSPAGLIALQWDNSEVRPVNVALLVCIKH